jgi:uncharacterized protein (TIGR02246 family)
MKLPRLLTLAGLAISFALPSLAQEQNTISPTVRQQIEAVFLKFQHAYNAQDLDAIAALHSQNAIELRSWEGLATGDAITKRFALDFTGSPGRMVNKIVALYPIGNAVCEIANSDVGGWTAQTVTVYVREGADWKAAMTYVNNAMPTEPREQSKAPDPKVREQYVELAKKFDEAWNNNDAAAMTALYADDAVIVTDTGPIQGREAISKHFEDLFQNVHFSNHVVTVDAYSPHIIGTTGNEIRWNGSWATTLQVKGSDPVKAKGYWSMVSVRAGDTWKCQMEMWNVSPAPPPSASTVDSQQLRDLNKKFDDGFLSGDATAVAALYAQDAVIVSPDPEPIHGRDAIEKHWADVFNKVHFSKHARTLDQTADNGLWMTGNWDATFQVKNGSAMKVNGRYLNILVRQGDALKFQVETYDAAGPPVPAEAK